MPRITSITVAPTTPTRPGDGLKGQTFHEDLDGVDVFVGPNGAGKTTRGILGIVSALEGLARTPTDPRRPYLGAARPENTSVQLTTSDGQQLVRDLSLVQGRRVAEVDGQARTLIGRLPTSWDLSDWAAGTSGTRGRILDDVARAGGQVELWDAQRAQDRVREIMVGTGEDGTVTAAALDACLQVHPSADDGETWIRSALVWAEDYATSTNRAQREAEGHHQGIRERAPRVPEHDPAALEAEEDALRSERADLRRGSSRRAEALQRVQQSTRTGARLQAELDRLTAEGRRLAQPVPEPSTGPGDEDLREALRRATEAHERAASDADAARELLAEAEAPVAGLAADLQVARDAQDEARGAVRKARAMVEALASLSSEGVCVHCGEEDPLGVDARQDAAQAALDEALQALDAATAPALEAERAARDADGLVTEARADLRRAEAAEARAAAARDQADRDLHGAGAQRDRVEARHRAQVEQRERDLQSARARWAEARDAVATWREQHEALEVPEVEDVEPRLQQIAARLSEIEGIKASAALVQRHRAEVERAARDYTDARATWDSARALVAALRTARDELAAAAYQPIHEAARALLDGAGLPLPFFRGLDDYGAEVRGRETPYHALSESEAMITAAALVYALSALSRQPVRLVLLDGLEAVQSDHRGPLLAALVRAQAAGLVDTVVATMATATAEEIGTVEVDGVRIHGPTYAELPPPAAGLRPAVTSSRALPVDDGAPIPPVQGDTCPF